DQPVRPTLPAPPDGAGEQHSHDPVTGPVGAPRTPPAPATPPHALRAERGRQTAYDSSALGRRLAVGQHLVDDSVVARLLRGQNLVTFDVVPDLLGTLPRVPCQRVLHQLTDTLDLLGLDLEVRHLTVGAFHRGLVDHDPRV